MLAPRAAPGRLRRTAPSPRRRCAPLGAADEHRPRPQLRQRLAARLVRRPVDDQDAVEVVDLVLDDPRVEVLELHPHRLRRRDPAHRASAASRRSTGTRTPCIERQPSSALSRSSPIAVTTGFTNARARPSSSSPSRQTNMRRSDADLGRGEADSARVGPSARASARPGCRRSSSNASISAAVRRSARIGVLADLRKREPPARFALRISLLLRLLFEDLPVLLGHGPSVLRPGRVKARSRAGLHGVAEGLPGLSYRRARRRPLRRPAACRTRRVRRGRGVSRRSLRPGRERHP